MHSIDSNLIIIPSSNDQASLATDENFSTSTVENIFQETIPLQNPNNLIPQEETPSSRWILGVGIIATLAGTAPKVYEIFFDEANQIPILNAATIAIDLFRNWLYLKKSAIFLQIRWKILMACARAWLRNFNNQMQFLKRSSRSRSYLYLKNTSLCQSIKV
jgi:hypothetical protein